jgi:hypothetical protein
MVALVITGLVIAAVFTLGGASARHFQEQQRIGVTQRSARIAMDRVRRDLGRAGYLGVTDTSTGVRMCPTPALPRRVQAIWFENADATGVAALGTINGPENGVSADRVRLTGNFTTGDAYLVRTFDGAGTTVTLQTDWLGFRRGFVNGSGASATVDTARFSDVFRVGRMLHIESPNGFHVLTNITASSLDATGTTATISISPGIGVDNPCFRGLGRGSAVAPISEIEYFIGSPATGSSLLPRNATVTGANTVLFRRELNMTNQAELAGTRRPVLEYAIDFNLDFVLDTNTNSAQPPEIVIEPGVDAQGIVQGTPSQVRGVIVTLAARTPEQDARYPWPEDWTGGRPSDAPLNRYRVFTNRQGAARVRQLTTEVQMPNLVP